MRKPRGRRPKGTLNSSLLSPHSVTDSNDISVSTYTPAEQTSKMGGNGKKKTTKATWPPHFEKALLDIVKSQKKSPGRKRFSMTVEQLNGVAAQLLAATGMPLDARQVQGKLTRWIKDWRVWKKLLLHSSGLGYRDETGMIISDDWEALERMIPGAGDWNGKAFPLFDELDELLSDEMADERKAISSNYIGQSSGKFVSIDESDEDNTMAAASDECESPLPKEKSKGKRAAQVDIGSAAKSRKSSEGVSKGLQSCFETFNRSVSQPLPDKDKEFSRGIVQAMKALHVDARTYAVAVSELSKDKVLGNIFIESDEAEQRAIIDLYLGK